MSAIEIIEVERQIDAAFADNKLKAVPWTQSAWTLLAVAEDHHLKITTLSPREAAIYVDGLMNSLTHPVRILHREAPKEPRSLERRYIDAHYTWARDWLDSAEEYNQFCSIFPLYHAKEIDLKIDGNYIEPTDWSSLDLSYETYDRLIGKRDPNTERPLNTNAIAAALKGCLRSSGGMYSIDFTRRLVDDLVRLIGPAFEGRHVLPENWGFSRFSLAQYRTVFICLQVLSEAWFVARQIVAARGVVGVAYEGSVWTPGKEVLVKLLTRTTKVPVGVVREILRYLTFGEVGVRNPDVAIQPLLDMGNGHYGISPFLMTQVHAERNLCVLLNQIPPDRRLYAQLVDEKEEHLRHDTINSLSGRGFDFKHGRLDQTDVDLAVIDHASKVCLCIELKWFIEPAEIREVMMRSEELAKGVSQAKKISALFRAGDERLLSLLGIERDYEFLAMVGSVNFIGRPGIQDSEVPITKLWHLIDEIQKHGNLRNTLQWLTSRLYLPVKHRDYEVKRMPISCGPWRSHWYGITHA
jgi:hypothetical protein